MKIISKFKDYYDGGMFNGIDETRVYVRSTEELEYTFEKYTPDFDLIGFCGKLYFFINELDNEFEKSNDNIKYFTLHGAERFKYIFNNNRKYCYVPREKIKRLIRNKDDGFGNSNSSWAWGESHKGNESYVNSFENKKEFLDLFLKHKVPIFWLKKHHNRSSLVLNPNLKQLGFAKVLDTHTAFQELEMYMGSVLCDVSQPPQPVGSDEVIGRGKGFDEYSFRNAKKKPKKF